jgi:ectoine hydroxylase-related dioxygenase (phytanoyl-CoA dioxygenase family)
MQIICDILEQNWIYAMHEAQQFFDENGYYIARGLFSSEEVANLRDHYMRLWASKSPSNDPTVRAALQGDRPDPLQTYNRLLQMHRWDQLSLDFLIDQRLCELLTTMLGSEPYAVQTMLYYKPAGSRGQALHQDQFYLRVQPGTCCAAWLALDDSDEENGCMQVVAGSHRWDILCTVPADTRLSFTDVTVPLPDDVSATPCIMKAGDVLFFHGSTVHGSLPNTSTHRFRRSLIGHYAVGSAEKIGEFYHPVLRMDGSVAGLGYSEGSTSCGVWVDQDGQAVIEMVEKQTTYRKHE